MRKHLHKHKILCLKLQVGKLSILTELFILITPQRFLAVSHSKLACGYGKDSTLNAELLNLTPQTHTAPLIPWFPPRILWLIEGPGGGGLC